MPTENLAKWQIPLSEFDIVYITQKAIKGQALSHQLAENQVDGDYEPLTTYFQDKEVLFAGEDIAEPYPGWRIFFDGEANFKGVGIGVVIISESEQHYPASTKIIFPCANNMAEDEACILEIRMVVDMNVKELLFTKIKFKHVPRIQNEFANAFATLSSVIQHPDKNYIDPIEVEIRDQHAYFFHVGENPDVIPWYHDVREFLATIEYPENATNSQKRAFRRLMNHFFLSGEVLQ
ncbi:uncharacterized protein [Nicotiana tomentosiformis]|uniref:uncharacterized protein n=1 Tax=Nicotiana tomentosiformis TaxID=4098 RepID=UPI00388CB9A0